MSMLTRREFLRTAGLLALAPYLDVRAEREIWVNDVHSQMNRTRIRTLLTPRRQDELAQAIGRATRMRNCFVRRLGATDFSASSAASLCDSSRGESCGGSSR